MPKLYNLLKNRFSPRVDTALSRREMLKLSLGVGAGLLMSNHVAAADDKKRKEGKRIVIVGAGFAGLAAAYELHNAGYSVTVVEARKRVGGRVLSFNDFVPGKNVEGGGELIGSNHPLWVAYADKFKLQFLDVGEEEGEQPVILNGKRLSAAESKALLDDLDTALNQMNAAATKIDADKPWDSPNAEKLDRQPTSTWIESLSVSPLCKQAITAQLTADNGISPVWQSFLGNLASVKGGGLEKYWSDSEVYRCKGGNQQLAEKLADAVGRNNILSGSPVTAIIEKDKMVSVLLADGRKLVADDVILATAPTVWKRITIDPALPAQLRPQMGSNVKYLMHLKKAFWKDGKLVPDSLTDGPISMTWDGTDGQGEGEVAMNCFSGGDGADICRTWQGEDVQKNYLAEAENLFPGIGAQFVKARFMDWPSDYWTGASYAFPAPGQITTLGPLMRKGHSRIHFAGEHTCYAFIGYMEGALNSGAGVAKRLAKRDGILKT